ncbi:MAG: aminotransferase class I/II-fold pyridoxal phosphate-dependent enzyme [Bacteroidetes bacterium]|nr:aminotransferase class I/II-fold pyridoxal phosphate-dependent enzyme [Bacteroidota bacterium]
MELASKLPQTGTTIFSVMSAMAQEYGAVNLGQGFPDFPMHAELITGVQKAMEAGYNQYAPMPGWLPLREAIAEKSKLLYQTHVDPEFEITITPGATYAIYTALTTILQPGDEVIFFEPAYDSYIPNILLNGAKPVPLSLTYPDYQIDWGLVRQSISPRTKAIIINSPHNPTGTVLKEDDIQQLKSIIKETGIFIISDEVYEHLIYDTLPHLSLLRYPELFERSFICSSFGKTYHCTGWKLGYCVAPAPLMKEYRKVHQYLGFSCFTPTQVALGHFLQDPQQYLSLLDFYQKKRDYFIQLLQQSKFELLPCSGSFFICASYANISNEKDTDFATRLVKEFGIATIPVSAFYHNNEDNHVIRMCFAKKETTLEAAAERLLQV